ncbi:MAG: TlpA family protein disulfide reductase [Undibacterium sp.]|nr:TlpA family protein disulfide reductase [Undibacterium sp.]
MQSKSQSVKALAFALILIIGLSLLYKVLWEKQRAPELNFLNIKGEKIALPEWRGKLVLINFWATTCTTCVAEMPDMIATYNKYHTQGLEFVAVAMQNDQPNLVVNFAETRELPFHVSLDMDGKIAQAFGDVRLTPTTFLIDKQGNIIKRYVGKPSFEELHQLLEKELKA